MEAEDTVIKSEGMQQAVINNPDIPMGQAIAVAQAEITWPIAYKAGEKQGYDKGVEDRLGLEDALTQKLKTERQEGRKEAVDFVEQLGFCSKTQWQAQVKKWLDSNAKEE